MARRTLGIKGWQLTIDVPDRVVGPLRDIQRRASSNSRSYSAEATGDKLLIGSVPGVAPVRRDSDRGLAFIRDRLERRDAHNKDAPSNGSPKDDAATLSREVAAHPWYHTIVLPHGVVTPGYFDHRPLLPIYGIPDDLGGKNVLDVGTADGFWAFEFEERGGQVTALDVDSTAELDLPPVLLRTAAEHGLIDPLGGGFALAHRVLGSGVKRIAGSVYDLDPNRFGRFDLVHAGDILLHLRDPIRALHHICSVTGGEALLSDVFDPTLASSSRDENQLVRYLGGWVTAGWWIPALGTLVQMVADAGFSDVEVVTTYRLAARGMQKGPWRAVLRARP